MFYFEKGKCIRLYEGGLIAYQTKCEVYHIFEIVQHICIISFALVVYKKNAFFKNWIAAIRKKVGYVSINSYSG